MEKKFENLIMKDAHKMKNEAMNLSRQNKEISIKEAKIANENKIILKKDKEQNQIEMGNQRKQIDKLKEQNN